MTPKAPLFTLRRAVLSVLLAAAVGGMIVAFTMHEEPRPVVYTNSAVRAVAPEQGEHATQRSTVFIELQPGFVLRTMRFDAGEQIGAQDLDVITGLNRYSYTPGEGKQVKRLDAGRRCAIVEFADTTRVDAALQEFSWCFVVQH
ncbi:MAG TPA: hypothetical protein VM938_14430 [Acidimicrobiales bacterium]|nr:hypothetical protein [Acidimicrobiales bacterium]